MEPNEMHQAAEGLAAPLNELIPFLLTMVGVQKPEVVVPTPPPAEVV